MSDQRTHRSRGSKQPPSSRPTAGSRPASGWVSEHPLLAFVGLTYTVSWTLWGLAWILGDSVFAMVVFIAGAFGPATAAVIVQRRLGVPLRPWALAIIHWRVAPRFVAYALLLPVCLFAIANVSLMLLGEPVDVTLITERAAPYLGTLVFVMLIGGGQEEPGWRGFLLPRLEARYGPGKATLLLGVIWGVWHIPIYGPIGFAVPLLLAAFYTWLYNGSGSVLLAMILHGGLTASQDHLILLPEETHGVTDLAIGIAYVLGLAVLLLVTRGRLGLPAKQQAPRAGPQATTSRHVPIEPHEP